MHTSVLIVYCVAALAASLAGGSLPALAGLTHTRLQTALSFVAGLMLGMALLHLIPHATHQVGSLDRTVQWALVGFLAMFFVQRVFHYHRHDVPEPGAEGCHCHAPEPTTQPAPPPGRRWRWIGTFAGLGLHSVFDGLALAAAVAAESHGAGLVGFGTALAVILHKPFDAMAVTTLVHASRSSPLCRNLVNLAFALITPLGVGLFALGLGGLAEGNAARIGCALAFCAGTFLCISCSDLLPELHFHKHDRLKLSLALGAGLAVSVLVGRFETTGHDSDPNHGHPHAHELPRLPAPPK